jgi:glycosyltransferase involved in cell wall biosynthesis
VRIRFLLLNADAGSGIVRATFQTAGMLAENHDVDIVSVARRLDEPLLPFHPRLRLHSLIDVRPSVMQRRRLHMRAMRRVPSRLIHPADNRGAKYFTMGSDIALVRAIREIHDGVIVGTRSSISLAVARFARPTAYAVAQEHQNLGIYDAGLRRSFAEIYPRLDAAVTLTPGDASAYAEMLPPEVLVRDIPNALPVRRLPVAQSGARVIVAAGRLAPQKGFIRLVKAFEQVHRCHPEWRLHIFGKGRNRKHIAAFIGNRGLDDVVVLRGFSRSLLQDMAETGSIFALSSRFEGYPIVLIEAMSVGLAPVAFDCPTGPADIIEDGTSGILVRPRTTAAMAAALNELIENPARREQMAAASRERSAQFSEAVVAPQWESLLHDLGRRRPGQRRPSVALPPLLRK